MRAKFGLAVLLLSVLFWAPGGPAAQLAAQQRLASLDEPLLQPASVTVPQAPVVVDTAGTVNNRGWTGAAALDTSEDLSADVLAAYTLAVAVSPTACNITTPMLAAVGQVESGNLAGRTLDGHRVSPEILGPVLDGKQYHAVADTDAGTWDGNQKWDRALGPMQIIPASWRVVGLDMDADGVRDPQNIYDAAGAAMVYLCAGGRDLGTSDGLREAILSYNDSADYLRAVLAWKAVFDEVDLTGMGDAPFVSALAVPLSSALALDPSTGTRTPVAAPNSFAGPVGPATLAPRPSVAAPSSPSTPSTPTGATPTPSPQAPTSPSSPTPAPVDETPGPRPTPPTGTPATEPPPPPASEEPGPATPTPTPELPECPVPTEEPTDPAAEPPADQPVVSPETCTPPEGYVFDPETDELVAVPVASPTP